MLKQRLHAYGSISEREQCRFQIIPQHNSLQTKITSKFATAFRQKHSTFLRHKVIRALPNATVL